MKQKEHRYKNILISVECYPTFRERLKMLFSKGFGINIHLTGSVENGEVVSYRNLKTY